MYGGLSQKHKCVHDSRSWQTKLPAETGPVATSFFQPTDTGAEWQYTTVQYNL